MCDYSKWDKFSDADSDNSDCEGQGGLFSGVSRFVKSLGPGAGGEGAPPLWSEGPNGVPEALEQTLRFGVGDKVEGVARRLQARRRAQQRADLAQAAAATPRRRRDLSVTT